MPQSLEDTLLSVWRQTLIENAEIVNLDGRAYPLQITRGRKLKQIDFSYGDRNLRGLEQNPATKSRWAIMASQGKKVMQFLENGRYVAVVADGKVKTYSRLGKKKPINS